MSRGRTDFTREEAKERYKTTGLTIPEVAAEYEVPESTAQYWSSNDGWVEAREDYRTIVAAKTEQKAANAAARERAKLREKTLDLCFAIIESVSKQIAAGKLRPRASDAMAAVQTLRLELGEVTSRDEHIIARDPEQAIETLTERFSVLAGIDKGSLQTQRPT